VGIDLFSTLGDSEKNIYTIEFTIYFSVFTMGKLLFWQKHYANNAFSFCFLRFCQKTHAVFNVVLLKVRVNNVGGRIIFNEKAKGFGN
jgi:hypothetical protein